MKTLTWAVGIGVSLAFVAPAFGIENPAWTDSVSEATPKHFLHAQLQPNQTGTVKWFNQTGTVKCFNESKGFGFITPTTNLQMYLFISDLFKAMVSES